jgi:hypothetical protein
VDAATYLDSARAALARLMSVPQGGSQPELLGTAFAVAPNIALTSFHCVGDNATNEVRHGKVRLDFVTGDQIEATVDRWDAEADFAVLRLAHAPGKDVQLIPLLRGAGLRQRYRGWGFPPQVTLFKTATISGEITNPTATLANGAHAFQLLCNEVEGELDLRGMSGGPILVAHAGHEAAVAIVRQMQWRGPGNPLALGNTFAACPVKTVIDACPELDARACCQPKAAEVQQLVKVASQFAGSDGVPTAPNGSPWTPIESWQPHGEAEPSGTTGDPLMRGDIVCLRLDGRLQTRWKDPISSHIVALERDGGMRALEQVTTVVDGQTLPLTGYVLCIPGFGIDVEWREATHVWGSMWGPIKLKTVRAFVDACAGKAVRARVVRISQSKGNVRINVTCTEYDAWLAYQWPYYRGLESALSRNALYQAATAIKLRQEGHLLPVVHSLLQHDRLRRMIPVRYRYLMGERDIDPLDAQLVLQGLIDRFVERRAVEQSNSAAVPTVPPG